MENDEGKLVEAKRLMKERNCGSTMIDNGELSIDLVSGMRATTIANRFVHYFNRRLVSVKLPALSL
jgi:hypothetical protein